MKEKSSFRLNAIALAFTAYEGRIKRIFKQQQAEFVKGNYKGQVLILYGPDESEIVEATEMLWQAYLCRQESVKPEASYALAVAAPLPKVRKKPRAKKRGV